MIYMIYIIYIYEDQFSFHLYCIVLCMALRSVAGSWTESTPFVPHTLTRLTNFLILVHHRFGLISILSQSACRSLG